MSEPGSRPAICVTLDRTLAPATRIARWQDVMRMAGELTVPDPDNFTAEFTTRNLGDMLTVAVRGSTYRMTRNRAMAATMPREHVIVNLLTEGRWTGSLAGRALAMRPGDVVLSQATNRLDLLMEDAAWLGMLIPRIVFERHMRWQSRFDGSVFAADSVQAALLGGLIRSLCSLPDALPPRDIARVNASCLALLLTCLGGTIPAVRDKGGDRDATLRAIRRYITDNLADPALGVDLISQTFGLSRSGLYRMMGENGDVARLVRSLRLEGAVGDLRQFDCRTHPMSVIAARWGFANERSFRRAFVREFGCSPSDLRDGSGSASVLGPVATDMRRWLLGL